MFERLLAGADDRARALAGRHRDALARHLAAAAPPDVAVETEAEVIKLAGRGLRRRLALDPAMRWLLVEMGR